MKVKNRKLADQIQNLNIKISKIQQGVEQRNETDVLLQTQMSDYQSQITEYQQKCGDLQEKVISLSKNNAILESKVNELNQVQSKYISSVSENQKLKSDL